MKPKINMKVFITPDKTDNNDPHYLIKGRLLGVVTRVEATKILLNPEVASKISTIESVLLVDAIKAIYDIRAVSVVAERYARLLVAITSIVDIGGVRASNIASRHLFISEPIKVVTETTQYKNTDSYPVSFTCESNTIIIANEEEMADKE